MPSILTYLRVVLTVFCGALVVVAANALFLWRTGELAGLSDVVAAQAREAGLYNSQTFPYLDYKDAMYQLRRPDVVALGSSRALQVRDYAFSAPFYNLGGTVRAEDEAFRVTDRLFHHHRPKVVLYFLDFWHFCARGKDPVAVRPPTVAAGGANAGPLLTAPLHYLWQQRLSLQDYADIVLGRKDRFSPILKIGFLALLRDNGTSADGSHYYGLSEPIRPTAERFDLAMVDDGRDVFMPGCSLSEQRMALLERLSLELREKGVRLVPIIAPMPPPIIDRMQASGRFAYVEEWRREVVRRLPDAHDFFDARPLGTSACEFHDYDHGGEVVYLRLLRELAERDLVLAGMIDGPRVEALIESGRDTLTVAANAVGDAYRAKLDEQGGACPERGRRTTRR